MGSFALWLCGLLLVGSVARADEVLSLKSTLNSWLSITPAPFMATTRILHSATTISFYGTEALFIYGGYGVTLQNSTVSEGGFFC
jgi:hypothetical protein